MDQLNHTPVIDSLDPVTQSSPSIMPSNHDHLSTVAVVVLVVVGLSAAVAMLFVLVRYSMRRAAIKRRRQASWILRSGHWNMDPKRAHAHDTGSDASSSFVAYPYPVLERLDE